MISTADTLAACGAPRFAGGASSITPPATLHDTPDSLRMGGEDWFEVCLYLRWDLARLAELAKVLDAEKELSKGRRGKLELVTLPGAGGQWEVAPHGYSLGGGPCVSWEIARAGIRIGLVRQQHAEPHETSPSAVVIMSGECLTPIGDARVLWEIVVRWLHQLGAEVVKAKVSRVDLCADLPDQGVTPFVEALREGRVIRKTISRKEHSTESSVYGKGRKDTGLYLGSQKHGAALARIYDKSEECRDLAKRAYLIRERWGHDTDAAVRVEFQLRREFLTAAKCRNKKPERPVIDTVEDYFANRAELAEYLVTTWLRFVCPGHDARHTERSRNLPVWDAVCAAFRSWTGAAERKTFRPLERDEVSVEDLAVQIRGCAESMAARLGLDVESPDVLLGILNEEIWTVIETDRELPARVNVKRQRLAVLIDDEGTGRVLSPAECPF